MVVVVAVVVVVVVVEEQEEAAAEADGEPVPWPSELKDCPDERLRIRLRDTRLVKKWPASPSTNL